VFSGKEARAVCKNDVIFGEAFLRESGGRNKESRAGAEAHE
jgi:hypothetical protein